MKIQIWNKTTHFVKHLVLRFNITFPYFWVFSTTILNLGSSNILQCSYIIFDYHKNLLNFRWPTSMQCCLFKSVGHYSIQHSLTFQNWEMIILWGNFLILGIGHIKTFILFSILNYHFKKISESTESIYFKIIVKFNCLQLNFTIKLEKNSLLG